MRTTALALVVDGVVLDLIEELVFARTPRLLNLSSQPVRVWALERPPSLLFLGHIIQLDVPTSIHILDMGPIRVASPV